MKLKLISTAILMALLSASHASALSCAKPDIIKSLEKAKDSDKLYQVIVGKFVTEAVKPRGVTPKPHSNGNVPLAFPLPSQTPTIRRAMFEGYALAKDPQDDSQLTRFPIDVQTTCLGSWCSSPPSPNREVVAFVEVRDQNAPLLVTSPCPTWVFRRNIPVQVSNLRTCLDKNCGGLPLRDPDAYTHPRPRR